MKKVLLLIIMALLITGTVFLIFQNISIANWRSKNLKDVKNSSNKLNEDIDIAKQINNQEYLENIDKLEDSIKQLQLAKEKYQTKINYISDDANIGVVEIKEYKIERLWIVLENYALDENVELKLDLIETETKGVYDLDVTLVGEYIGITDFIYDIENDDTLNFKITNFKLTPNSTTTNTTTAEGNNIETANNTTENNTVKKGETLGNNIVENNAVENNETLENNTVENNSASVNNKIQPKVETENETTTTITINKLKATFKIKDVGIELN